MLLRLVLAAAAAALLLYHGLIVFRVYRLRETNPDTTALIERRKSEAAARGSQLNPQRVWTPYEQLPPALLRAVVAAEDPRFYTHSGLDWQAIRKAARVNWEEKRLARGASTISQQLARNLFLSDSRNPLRKLHEAVIACEMERILGKRRILELYLNVIEWGEGIYGAEAAARHYFKTSAASLDEEQAAFLAAIIPGPLGAYNPGAHPERVSARRDMILAFIREEEVGEETLRRLAAKTVPPSLPAGAGVPEGEGVAVVQLHVDAQGNVEKLGAVEAPHPALKDAFARAVTQWKFDPPQVNGQPVSVRGRLTFHYVVEDGTLRVLDADGFD